MVKRTEETSLFSQHNLISAFLGKKSYGHHTVNKIGRHG
jgi:hypothetical protein